MVSLGRGRDPQVEDGRETGALENELLRMSRGSEAEQQALVRVPREQQLEILALFARQAQKACAHRVADTVGGFFMQGPQGMGA